MPKNIAILLDTKRSNAVKGSPIETKVVDMFGGALKAFIVEVSDEHTKTILDNFATARVDNRGFITDVPVAFNKATFEEIAKQKSLGSEVIAAVLTQLPKIKEAAAKESDYLPAPDLD